MKIRPEVKSPSSTAGCLPLVTSYDELEGVEELRHCVCFVNEWPCVLIRHGGSTKVHFHSKVRETQSNVQLVDDPSVLPDALRVRRDLMAIRLGQAKDGGKCKPPLLRNRKPSSRPQ